MEPFFSILMPAYNAEKDIYNSIMSVLNQTFLDFQLIIIDDGSTDSTYDIVERFRCDERITIRHQKNTGIAGAYQEAIKYINGKYLLFLDSDDQLELNTLKSLYDILKNNAYDIVQFGISYHNSQWEKLSETVFTERYICGREKICRLYLSGLITCKEKPNLSMRVYNSQLIKDFPFTKGVIGIDELMNYYMISKSNNIKRISLCFYKCQVRNTSVSRSVMNSEKLRNIVLCYENLELLITQTYKEGLYLHYFRYLTMISRYAYQFAIMPEYNNIRRKVKKYKKEIGGKMKYPLSLKIQLFFFLYCPKVSKLISKIKNPERERFNDTTC